MTRFLAVTIVLGSLTARAQSSDALERFAQRLLSLEQQNGELREQVKLLRVELDALKQPKQDAPTPAARLEAVEEQVQLQAGRITEHDQIKVQGAYRTPIRLTGVLLFNAYRNGRAAGGGTNYPTFAAVTSGRVISGATLGQSVVGMEFQSPDAILGGRFRGSAYMDFTAGTGEVLNLQPRLRTASIEGQWKTRGFLVGQERPIFAPRELNSLAQVTVAPLTGSGNLWRWRPQARFEQRVKLGPAQELRAHIGISQTAEDLGAIPAAFLTSVEPRRPALEGNFRFSHRIDDTRRVEIAPAFHWSSSHVAGVSVPASVFAIDWFANPVRPFEFSGTAFAGKNMAKLGGLRGASGFTIRTPRPGVVEVTPVHGRGGWAQVTWLAASRLSFNLFAGLHDFDNRDLAGPGLIHKNLMYGTNFFYRLAPNVVSGIEISQVRTWYQGGPRPLNNHYDLYVGYLF